MCRQVYYGAIVFNNVTSIIDINECQDGTDDCIETAACNNNAGSFSCSCLPGYEGNGFVCTGIQSYLYHFTCVLIIIIDINECTTGGHNCSTRATCTNTAGSFSCACNPGYEGNGVNCSGNINSNFNTLLKITYY